jgi:hypothetical protein
MMSHYAQPPFDDKVIIVINNDLEGFLHPKELHIFKPDVLISNISER